MKDMPKRKVAGLLAGLLLGLNVVLALTQSSGALPLSLGNRFLGPNMLRAEIDGNAAADTVQAFNK